MQRNVISEIKNLNNCMVKKLFTLGKKEDEKKEGGGALGDLGPAKPKKKKKTAAKK